MEAIIERCAGLDVHQASVVACVLCGPANQRPRKEVRTFGTMTCDLLELRDWLLSHGVTAVGMESTGVYWKPIYAVLEDHAQLIVGNAHHIKNVPGRKTDVKDSEWIADLIRHGLISASFVPPKPIQELRDLLRYRDKLTKMRTQQRNGLLKILETAGIKLSSVATDVFGVSGMAMLKALVAGERSPAKMAEMAKGRLRKKIPELEQALEGRIEPHHCFLLDMQIQLLEQIGANVARLETEIELKLEPFREQHKRLTTIPGVDFVVAAIIIAELGVQMSVFPTEQDLAAWVGVCPGSYESAGRRKSVRIRKGNVHLKTALVQAAKAAAKQKGSYLKDKYWRLKARRGAGRATIAVAHKILVSAYHMLSKGTDYHDLGESFLDQLDRTRTVNNLVKRLKTLGCEVHVTERPPNSPEPERKAA